MIEEKNGNDHLRKKLANAKTFIELASLHNYDVEEHVVYTADGFLITIFRITGKIASIDELGCSPVSDDSSSVPISGVASNRPTVLLLPGLMMSSDVFVVHRNSTRCLPFYLFDLG